MPYLDVDRCFMPFSNEEETELKYHYFSDGKPLGGFNWAELLEKRRIVILAEAGAGKTAEMLERSAKLSTSGHYSFYTTINELGRKPLRDCLITSKIQAEFDAWHAGNDEAIIFADSLDEARLDGQNFQSALGNIEKAVGESLHRVTIVISSRVSDWRPVEDLNVFQNTLCHGVPNEQAVTKNKSKDWILLNPVIKNGGNGDEDKISLPDYKPTVVAIAPLTSDQATKLAKWRGVQNSDEFLTAILKAEAQTLANRPQDLFGLVDLWNKEKKIGGKRDILDWSIRRRLRETNQNRASDNLSETEAMEGAKLIASSLTFGKNRFISWPINPSSNTLDDLTLNPKDLLADWSNEKQAHLLNRAVFDPASLGRVRFHHRSVQEYLTALWLLDLISRGCPRRKVWDLLSSNLYGEYVLRPTFRPVCSWLGQLDEWFRKKISEIAPEVLIESGDPSVISVADRSQLLEMFCKLYADKDYGGVSIYLEQIQRLADPDLSPKIKKLWKRSKKSAENRKLLLRLIWVGEMKDCSDIVGEASVRRGRDYEKSIAIQALSRIGTKTQFEDLKNHVVKFASSLSSRIVGNAIETLYPDHLSVTELKEVLKKYGKVNKRKRRYSRSDIDYNISNICKMSDKPDSKALISAFADLAFDDPDTFRPRREPHSSKYYWLIDPAMTVLAEMCDHDAQAIISDPDLTELARKFSNGAAYAASSSNDGGKELKSAIRNNRQLNRHFFWNSVHRAQKKEGDLAWYRQAYELGELWEIREEDFEWALKDIKVKAKPNDKFIAVNVALNIWAIDRSNTNRLDQIKAAAGKEESLNQEISKWENPPENKYDDDPRWKRRQRKSEKKWNKVKKNRALSWLRFRDEVVENPHLINGTHNFGYLFDMVKWSDAVSRKSETRSYSLEPIGDAFSQAVLKKTKEELIRFWRSYYPLYPSQVGQNEINGIRVGLRGIELEAALRPNWVASLSDNDVILATRYALHEQLSTLEPVVRLWCERESLVRPILQRELEWEFSRVLKKGQSLYYLSHCTAHSKEPFLALAASLCMDIIEKNFPKNEESLKNAIDTITRAKNDHSARLAKVAEREFFRTRTIKKRARWMAIWIACSGLVAVTALEVWIGKGKKTNRPVKMWEVLLNLYNHHDSTFTPPYLNFDNLAALEKLVVLAHRYVDPIEDAVHEGSYTPDARDNVERARSGLFSMISNKPGENTYKLILKLITMPEFKVMEQYYRVSARRRAISDADIESWEPIALVAFQTHFEKKPQTQKELHAIVLYRIDDIFDGWETGDYSAKDVLRQDHMDRADETIIQLALAKEFEQRRNGAYTLEREPEVIDAKKPDIRINSDSVNCGIPIEIKVADSWSLRELKEAIKDQLVGRYMRSKDEQYGVFALTYHGKKQHWRHEIKGQQSMNIDQLSFYLQTYANELVKADSNLERIDVVTVDLR